MRFPVDIYQVVFMLNFSIPTLNRNSMILLFMVDIDTLLEKFKWLILTHKKSMPPVLFKNRNFMSKEAVI